MGWTEDRVLGKQSDYSVWEAWTVYRLKRQYGAIGAENTAPLW